LKKNVIFFLFLLLSPILNAYSVKDGLQFYKNGELKKAAVIFYSIYKSKVKKEKRVDAFFYYIKTQESSSKRVREYLKFIKEFPTDKFLSRAFLNLALIYMNKEKYNSAINWLKRISKKSKLWSAAQLRLGQLYFKEKEYEKALLVFNQLVANKVISSSLKSKAYFGMGLTYEKINKPKESELSYLNVLNSYLKEGDVPATLYRLGNLYYAKKDWQMANDWFRKLVTKYPNSFDAYLAKGKISILRAYIKSARYIDAKSKEKVLVYEIQLAAYRNVKYAELYLKKIRKIYPNVFIFKQENKMVSLRMGFFKNRKDAYKQLIILKKNGIDGFIRTRNILLTETNFGR